MLRYLTAGESHGPCLIAVVEGLPYGTPFDEAAVRAEMQRRQGGYGRGARMKIEQDSVEVLGGVRRGRTIGSPLTMRIDNRVKNAEELGEISRVRPGHADLAGAIKYGTTDARDVSERSSARETASRVAAGAVAAALLDAFDVRVLGYVIGIGPIDSTLRLEDPAEIARRRDASPFYMIDPSCEAQVRDGVDRARQEGDTLGGRIEVIGLGLPPGLGSYVSWEQKLDGRLARALMSVQTVKCVEVGLGLDGSRRRGSAYHDPIVRGPDGKLGRTSNNAGGIEGGMTNGQPLIVRAATKPISTLRRPLDTVDLKTGEAVQAQYERSDVCVVPAASVIAQAVVAFELAAAFLEKFGGDTFEETRERYDAYRKRIP
jgi:chorismate synthase